MDFADHASERETIDRELALAAHRASRPAGPSASHCHNCDEPIPEARRQAVPGVIFCVDCQTAHERGRP